MKSNQVKIGNEHFKTWLKSLDPVARVEKMSIIAKTQASAGLKGSLIKASLAQLSQRCVVMLMKLTDKEIKLLTRRKPIKRLDVPVNSNIRSEDNFKYQNKLPSFSKSIADNSIKSVDDTTKLFVKNSRNPQNETKNVTKLQNATCNVNNKKEPAVTKHVLNKYSSGTNKKIKKKFHELFGEDYDEISVTKNGSDKESDSLENGGDRQVNNYVSTTVNVNIYNSTSLDGNEKDSPVFKRKLNTESTVSNGSVPSNKRLRIDVSLSSKDASLNDSIAIPPEKNPKSSVMNAERPHKNGRRRKPHDNSKSKHKSKKNTSKLHKPIPPSLNSNENSEDDPSIKELWSIFGMESPQDRSETINKSTPFDSLNSILDRASDPANPESVTGTRNECQPTLLLQAAKEVLTQPSLLTVKDISKNTTSIERVCEVQDSVSINKNTTAQETGIVCKIAETFSLVNSSEDPKSHDKNEDESQPKPHIEGGKIRLPYNTQNVDSTDTLNIIESDVISISEDEEIYPDENEAAKITNTTTKAVKNVDEPSKIGTIRVKNLGSLMNLQANVFANTNNILEPSLSRERNTEIDKSALSSPQLNVQEKSNTNKTDPQSFEECFFNIYKHYFDELVESKIPKLGELLHLAVADGLRRNDRIKRAEQLSSDDLIKEEKQRAEKDFNDMMRIRGLEFSPLCELILHRFDQSSKITLFNALFCRIMKHAEQIDPANKHYVFEARNVIQTMLSKHQFKDKEVSEFLQTDTQFQELMDEVRALIEKFDNQRKNDQHIDMNIISQVASVPCDFNTGINLAQIVDISDTFNGSNSSQFGRIAPKPTNIAQVKDISGSFNGSNNSQFGHVAPKPTNIAQVEDISDTFNGSNGPQFGRIAPKPTNIAQIEDISDSFNGSYGSQFGRIAPKPTNTLPGFRPQSQILRGHLIPVRNIVPPTITVNSSTNQAIGSLNTDPLQLSRSGFNFVKLPQNSRLSVRAIGGVQQSSNRDSYSRPVQIQKINQPNLASVAHTTMYNTNSVSNPSIVSFSLMPSTSSINNSTCNKPIYISPVSTKSHPKTTVSANKLQKTDGRHVVSEPSTHIVVNRIEPNCLNRPIHVVSEPPSHVVINRIESNCSNRPNILRKQQCRALTVRETAGMTPVSPSVIVKAAKISQSPTPVTNNSTSKTSETTSTTARPSKPTTAVTDAISSMPQNSISSNMLNTAAQIAMPSSSHCHPFNKRMPISGKMKMFFESTNK